MEADSDRGSEKQRITWHRTKIDRQLLADLNQRSDFWGALQTLGYLATLVATGGLAGGRRCMHLHGSSGFFCTARVMPS